MLRVRSCFLHARGPWSWRRSSCLSTVAFSGFGRHETELLGYLSSGRLQDARSLLDEITKGRSRPRPWVWPASLVTLFSRNGYLGEARKLLDIMPERHVACYNAMLSGYLRRGMLSEGRKLFEEMPERNVTSRTAMLSGLLDAGRVEEAKTFFEGMSFRNVVSWNAMVNGLVKNGKMDDARSVFDRIPAKNIASWNVIIKGCVENGRMEEARGLFEEMEERNVITYTSMISGYCRNGDVEEGYRLFCRTPEKNVVCWTAMIGGFSWNGFDEEALVLFLDMMRSSTTVPNVETFISVAYACAGLRFPCLGKQIHAQLVVYGLESDDSDGRLSKSLIHMYSEFGIMDYAHHILSCNSNGCSIQSYNSVINGYIRIGDLGRTQDLFDTAPCTDRITWTSMINAFFETGNVSRACSLFHKMPEKDSIAWTAMISGYVQKELFTEARKIFTEMRLHGFPILNSTCAVLCAAAGASACLDLGKQIHGMIFKSLSNCDLILNNSLISMYAKCGEIQDAFRMFSGMSARDVISWNTIIMGFSLHGLADEAVRTFDSMLESGISPNSVTFLGALSACAHAGVVSRGQQLFQAMTDTFSLEPGLEHCISMVHLLGRSGKLIEAEEFVLSMPYRNNYAIWGALLGVCDELGNGNASIAKRVARRLLELDPLNVTAHIQLSNICAGSGEYAEEHRVRKEMALKGLRKDPGISWIQQAPTVDTFLSSQLGISKFTW